MSPAGTSGTSPPNTPPASAETPTHQMADILSPYGRGGVAEADEWGISIAVGKERGDVGRQPSHLGARR